MTRPVSADELVAAWDAAVDAGDTEAAFAAALAMRLALSQPPDAGEGLREALHDLQDWLIHPDRSYSPHEIAMEAHDRIAAALAALTPVKPEEPRA